MGSVLDVIRTVFTKQMFAWPPCSFWLPG